MAFKTFNVGDVLTASDVNDYLMEQAVIACTSATRPSSPSEGMTIVETDTDMALVYSGSAWVPVARYFTGAYRSSSTSSQTSIGTSGTVSLTVSNAVFRAGWAYRAHIRVASVYGDAAGRLAHFRLNKTNAAGADWGEYGRVECTGTTSGTGLMANGSIILLRSAASNLTTDVALTVTASAGTVNLFASAESPRYLVIEPIGSASDYAGLGVDVT